MNWFYLIVALVVGYALGLVTPRIRMLIEYLRGQRTKTDCDCHPCKGP